MVMPVANWCVARGGDRVLYLGDSSRDPRHELNQPPVVDIYTPELVLINTSSPIICAQVPLQLGIVSGRHSSRMYDNYDQHPSPPSSDSNSTRILLPHVFR